MSAQGIGRQMQFGVAKETSRGTAESSPSFYIPWSEHSVDDMTSLVNKEASIGVIEDSHGAKQDRKWSEVETTAPIGADSFGLILLAALGSVSTSVDSPEAGANTHTFSVDQSNLHQVLTLFSDDPLAGQDYKYALGALSSLEISFELEDWVKFTATFNAKQGETASLSPSYTEEYWFRAKHLTFEVADSKSDLGGGASATTVKINSLTLTIEKNLEGHWTSGSDEPQDYRNTQFAITGEVEAVWEDESTFKTDFLANTAKAMRIKLENTDDTIGSTSINPKLQLDLPTVHYEELNRDISLNDVVNQSLSFKAHYDSSNSEMIDVELINGTASY